MVCFGSRWEGLPDDLFERDSLSEWDLSGLKDIFQVLDQLMILSTSAEREKRLLFACLKDEKNHTAEAGIISKERSKIFKGIKKIN